MPVWTSDRVAENRAQADAMPPLTEADMQPGFFSGALTGAALAVPGLVSRPLLAATEQFNPFLRSEVENSPELFGAWKQPIVDYLDWQRTNARKVALNMLPSPQTVGAAGQMLYGIGTMAPELIVSSMTPAGPVGAFAYETWVHTLNERVRLEAEGVDPETATKAAFISGSFAGGSAFLPGVIGTLPKALLPRLGYQVSTQAGVNVALGISSRAATHAFLYEHGYQELAAQIHPFALAEIGMDAAVAALFGTAMFSVHGKPAAEPRPMPRPAHGDMPTVDALTTAHSAGHMEMDTAPGVAMDARAKEAQVEALTEATMQLHEGVPPREIDVKTEMSGGDWAPHPPEVQKQRDAFEEAALSAIQDHEADMAKALADEFHAQAGELPLTAAADELVRATLPARPKATVLAPTEPPLPSPAEIGESNRRALIRELKNMGGVNIDEARDITGELRNRASRLMPGLFRRLESGGRGIDHVALRLRDLGYITDAEYESTDGGVSRAREIVNSLINKEPIYSVHDTEKLGDAMAAADYEDYQARLEAGDFNALQRGSWLVDKVFGEPARVAVTARLKKAATALDEGRAADGKLEVDLLIEDIAKRNEAQKEAAAKDRVRGADWIQERLMRASRTGELDGAQARLGIWLLERNPHLGEGLAISVKQGGEAGVAGSYNNLRRLITLISGKGDDTTVMHEILHHAERMMPPEIQHGIRQEWANRIANIEKFAQAYDVTALRRAVGDIIRANMGDTQSGVRVVQGIHDKVLPGEFYQYLNPSEFWAENASRIMGDRAMAEGSWQAKAKQWMLEFIEKVKGFFGLESDTAVLAGLRNLTEGNAAKFGEFKSHTMLIQDANRSAFRASMLGVFKSLDNTKPSAEYQKFRDATMAYRERKIGDAEFLKARAEYDAFLKSTEPDLLAPYTNEDVLMHERESVIAATKDVEARKAVEAKAVADAQRDVFTLTGSDLPADVAGQGSLFGEPTQQPVQSYPGSIDNPTSRETALAIADAKVVEAEANAEKAVNTAVGCEGVEG